MTIEASILAGKVAFVTGGSRGIGAAVVRRLVRDGATVVFTYSASPDRAAELVKLIEAGGGRAMAVQADSADADALSSAIDAAARRFDRLDILVNNAGVLLRGTVDDLSLADFDRVFAINVRAVFVAAQAAARHMKEGGRIVTIGSVVAERSAFAGAGAYSMSKGAVAALVRGLALDLAPRGITVNNVQPGPTETEMNPANGPLADAVRKLVPLQRLGTADEIAGLVAYLTRPESAFVTGASLTIDGGYLA